MMNRRKALKSGAALLAGGAALLKKGNDAEAAPPPLPPARGFAPVVMPNGTTVPFNYRASRTKVAGSPPKACITS